MYELTFDTRELILQRLLAILGDASIGAKTVVRDRGLLSNDNRPAVAMLDGPETARLTGDRKGRVRMSPTLVTMRVEIFFLPETRKPANVGLGEEVSQFRLTMIEAVANDTELIDLVSTNGNIAYVGMDTDLKSGGTLDGQCRLDFQITYVLDPS